jgi:hypothetical protein
MSLKAYVRAARALPPRLLLPKSLAFGLRFVGSRVGAARDRLRGSYGPADGQWNPLARIPVDASDIAPDLQATLRRLGDNSIAHRFDLLGSGWVASRYGFQAAGFQGARFSPSAPRQPRPSGAGLDAVINNSNVRRAEIAWRRLSPGYEPIDWQLDFRSGYRWSACRHSSDLRIPVDRGADVKVPWELGRLQHLPQLALCAVLAAMGQPEFRSAAVYVREIADQLLDFTAANPPRFGVQWMSTMDVAIRAANIALTLALLAGAGLKLDAGDEAIVLGTLRDHGAYIVEHLDYSERGRSNHYLSNIAGLIWVGWALAGDVDGDRWLAFGIAQLFMEAAVQFLADGGNYEGSTGYHRLSTEMVAFSLALVLSLDCEAMRRIEQATPPRRPWRAAFPKLPFERYRDAPGAAAIVPAALVQTLQGAARLSRAIQGVDGSVVQIGDTDSGRFFKLHPTARTAGLVGSTDGFVENALDHCGTVDAIEALLGARPAGRRFDAVVVHRLISGSDRVLLPAPASDMADHGDIDALIAQWEALPPASRRVRDLPLSPEIDSTVWKRAAFPDFGLYVFRNDRGHLVAFRCLAGLSADAPRGHTHDDNLGLEYRLGGVEFRDPGSFVYTPNIALRNRYRSAQAHDVPRARGASVAAPGSELFDLEHRAFARCLAWRPDGVAGEIDGASGRVLRIVRFSRTKVRVWDCVEPPAVLEAISPDVPTSRGYGRR